MLTFTHNTGSHKGKVPIEPQSKTTKSKKKGRNDVYDGAMQVISKISVWRGEKDKAMTRVYENAVQFKTPSPPTSDPESIMEMMLRLKGTPGIDAITFTNACANLESLCRRFMFASLDDESRITWMKYFIPRGQNSTSQNQKIDHGGRFGGPNNQSRGSSFVSRENGGLRFGGRFDGGAMVIAMVVEMGFRIKELEKIGVRMMVVVMVGMHLCAKGVVDGKNGGGKMYY